MSTISSNLSVSNVVQPLPLDTVSETSNTPTQRYTPLWLVNSPGSTNGFEALGIRAPSANGDLAVLLAEISLSLEKSVEENNKNGALASLSALASALGGSALVNMHKSVDNKSLAVAENKKTLDATTSATTTLLASQKTETDNIAGYRSTISGLEAALAKPGLSDAERTTLQGQLTAAQSGLNGAYARREAIDINLADARITSLGQQVADLQAQKARLDPNSAEAKTLGDKITAKNTELTNARSALDTFKSATKSDTTRDAFSSSTRTNVQTMRTDLTTGYNAGVKDLSDAKVALVNAAAARLAIAALTTANFESVQSGKDNYEAMREDGIERVFEAIAETLDDASKAVTGRIPADDGAQAATDADQARRLQGLAQALLDALSDTVSILAEQAGSPRSPMAVPPESVANRVRVQI